MVSFHGERRRDPLPSANIDRNGVLTIVTRVGTSREWIRTEQYVALEDWR